MQKSNYPKAVGRAACYNMGRLRNRTAYKNNQGVDRKHGSYQRYLARRIGGVLRAEQMPAIKNKTAYIGQPRIRTGTRCDCNKKLTTKKCQDENLSKDLVCCNNRIPAGPTSILTVGLDVAGYNFYGYLNSGTGALNPPFKIGGQDVQWIGYQARDPSGLSEFDNRFYVTLNTLSIATQNDLTSISFVGEDCSIKTYYGADAEFSPTASGNGTTWWWPAASQVGLPSDPNEVAYWSSQVGKNLKVYINTNPNLLILKPYISPSAQRTCVAGGRCRCCGK